MDAKMREDLCELFEAIDWLHAAAKAESAAFGEADAALTRTGVIALHEIHLDELNAVQTLIARADLFRVRYRDTLGYLGRH